MKNLNPIGLYPIVDSCAWVAQLSYLGVPSIQLRIKDQPHAVIETHIQHSVKHAKQSQLFINDYWELAIKHQAFGVHLGQEDVAQADIVAIKRAGLHLGISTHSPDEIDYALSFEPSYIALGPVYHTNTKIMPYPPQGLTKLGDLCNTAPCPVVAIGGIDLARIPDIVKTGVDGIAVLSAITTADDPDDVTLRMLAALTPC